MNMPAIFRLSPRVNHEELVLFTKHLAVMIKSGVSLLDALDTLSQQAEPRGFARVISGLFQSTKNGQALASSLSAYPGIFDGFYVNLVRVGETSGTLEQNLEFLSQQLTREFQLRKKIQGALLYPALVLGTTVIMGGFIALYILPKLVDYFSAFQVALPLSTRILLAISLGMQRYGLAIVSGLAACLFLGYWIIRIPAVRLPWDTMILRIPLFGKLFTYRELARFTRNFGILLKSGSTSVQSLRITSGTLSNERFVRDIGILEGTLSSGVRLGKTMEKERFHEFPPIVTKMISVGEKTGKLDEVLLYLGDYYEDEIDAISKNFATLLEPFLLIVIGLAVGFVALSIISPIYDLTGSIR